MEGEKIKFLNTEVQINPYHKIDDSLKRTDYTIKPVVVVVHFSLIVLMKFSIIEKLIWKL